MATVTYVGKVLSDGHLSLPESMREELGLEPGQEVYISLWTREESPSLQEGAYAPLRKLIGLGKTGKPDAAAHHDYYLYGKQEE